ncbi:MAG: helix-hairpin-helix domain-containing protein, partial [Elusimicrobiota bacterium]|nr:helix-hairpin-helix domain-containing protein [Elusimicrobiota bacterium]
DDLKEITHETKSGKMSYDFATSKGAWTKSAQLLMDADIFTVKDGAAVVDEIALYQHMFPTPADINTASVKDLSSLPGMSKKKAQLIIDNRPFSSLDGLKDVSYETKSGKTGYGFATSKGEWQKNIKILLNSGRLVCSGSKKDSKALKKSPEKKAPPAKAADDGSGDEPSDAPEDY